MTEKKHILDTSTIDPTDLLLISPEIEQEVDDQFHQPLLHHCTTFKKGTKVRNSTFPSRRLMKIKVWLSVKELHYRPLSWVLASPARLPSRTVGGSGTPAPSR